MCLLGQYYHALWFAVEILAAGALGRHVRACGCVRLKAQGWGLKVWQYGAMGVQKVPVGVAASITN